jgi:predicted ATPase
MQCSPTFENSTLYPFLAELQRVATIEDGDSAQEKLRKLGNGLSMGSVSGDVALAIFARLLGIPTTRPDVLEGISAERQRNIAEQAFIDLVGHLARATPILILFEDEQWADATSRDLLDKIVASLTSLAPAARLEQEPSAPWVDAPGVRHIKLEALGREDASNCA